MQNKTGPGPHSEFKHVSAEVLAACVIATSGRGPTFDAAAEAWALYELLDDDHARYAGQALAERARAARRERLTMKYEEYVQAARRFGEELAPLYELLQADGRTAFMHDVAEVIVMAAATRSPHPWLELVAAATDESIEGARDRYLPHSLIAHDFMKEHPEALERIRERLYGTPAGDATAEAGAQATST